MPTGRGGWIPGCGVAIALAAAPTLAAQVDTVRAKEYFAEAAALCARDGGRLWGRSLCGPMVFADAATGTIATNQPAPEGKRPPTLGFANAAIRWGDERWSTFVWAMIPSSPPLRGRLMIHELFHRIQPALGQMTPDGSNDHLDTAEGRTWIQLEWRALARALATNGSERTTALRDAVTFRAARHGRWPGAAENERVELVREGLAQYTATVVATPSPAAARADAIAELDGAANGPSLVRTFAYPTGTAYGILLEEWSPGWTRRFQPTDDLARLVATAAGVEAGDPDEAARRYDGDAIRTREARREADRAARVASLRERFVTGPVLILPNANGSFLTVDVTPIPEAGTVYPRMRVSGPWGELEADWALRTVDRSQLVVPLPMTVDGATLKGEDWIARLAPGWAVRPAPREGDRMVVRVAP